MEERLTPTEDTLEKIRADLKALGPPTNIVFAYGKPASFVTYLALYMAFAGIAHETPIVFLDGANSFDPFLISKIARRAGLIPEQLLRRIHISRAFTCHQMQALVTERLGDAFCKFDTNVAIVSGLLDTFYDQDVPFGEAHDLLRTTTAEFMRLAGQGARILIACPDTRLPLESRQRRFVNFLKNISNKVLQSEENNGTARFVMEKPYEKMYERLEIPGLVHRQRGQVSIEKKSRTSKEWR